MIVERILPFAKSLIRSHVTPESVVIDATCGNGHDTKFLADLVPNGHVYGCDIQKEAIEYTRQRVQAYNNISLFQTGHEWITQYIASEHLAQVHAAIFNLGYLPKGDKSIVTHSSTTLAAVQTIFDVLQPEGIIVLVVYPGHEEGAEESATLMQHLQAFDQQLAHVLKYEFINQRNRPPYVIALEKRAQ
ncbi:class I SAM-dependent methyltransferase [Staphylococcus intermedius]|uniref:rRNA methylase n=1 Tax=Staphylococcus intermedius NCTC 11048 TaxID=1141106 RepID=A0A380G7C5_STAIN|nr:class I SAM-dependent methyltransferase [Staphylococcus intermedius]PCF64617.1 16S rRNA (cytosine(1402)-N(4))-methyltransferase [Staphylococcus intermedius]PCF80227.1 16S rRNA (cytosine(1402)-N(4))-methyltransferase [Staphylococcus intermedius]PCF81577.1 16S rRNA (cytosine(1402)-N(4))-methyltransferase [Staphylococcus intermedius]PCF84337.1 16S rRNA (cytosine(1402)-N(4))-methyltransferase [Staphylococcus intermedius]PCF86443.1 16S rRNA (cytosine(1402)-N(4))-methyltransferase [Staphylococcus